MQVADNKIDFIKTLAKRFDRQRKTVAGNLALFTYCMLRSESCNTYEMARHAHEITSKSFDTNEARLHRFLQSKEFQVDDKLWRCHIGLVIDILKEYGLSKNDYIAINVDITSDEDDFLIISASIPLKGRGIPLYFSMRRYPKRAGMIDYKKFEGSFFRELRHLLPKEYQYVIVADRGFGHDRILNLCIENHFHYIIRINPNINIKLNNKISNIQKMGVANYSLYNAEIVTWKKKVNVICRDNGTGKWVLLTDLNTFSSDNLTIQYGNRFNIEKMFQDQKSSGFFIENSKIRKYDRFKRLYYIACLAQAITMFIGNYIDDNFCDIKKNFALHIKLISVFSS